MARAKDEKRRQAILNASKALFARNGFFNTSVADIVKDTGLPAGSIYTYFDSKEDIICTIVDEGWQEFKTRLHENIDAAENPVDQLKLFTTKFIPELMTDIDFITIILSEAVQYTRIAEKIEELTNLVLSIIHELSKNTKTFQEIKRQSMKAGLIVYFTGILNALKLVREPQIGVSSGDILDFIELSIENSLRIRIR